MASGEGHISLGTYYKVIGALMVFTVITVAVAQVDFGALNTLIAMLIASVKAALVLAYFMHLKYDDKLYLVCFGTAIFFLILMFFLSWVDIYTRLPLEGIL